LEKCNSAGGEVLTGSLLSREQLWQVLQELPGRYDIDSVFLLMPGSHIYEKGRSFSSPATLSIWNT
jgi:hypothetical protein